MAALVSHNVAAFQSRSALLRSVLAATTNDKAAGSKAFAVSISDNWINRGMSSSAKDDNDDDEDAALLDPLIVCGPSGVGKGTIIERFMSEEYGGKQHFGFTTSHTTRSPRPGEVDGIHYHFVKKADMKQMIEHGKFLESAKVHGNYYGTSWESLRDVQRLGKRCLLDIDMQGVKRIKALQQVHKDLSSVKDPSSLPSSEEETPAKFQPKYIFIAPVDFDSLKKRLTGRGTESAESLERRTQKAKEEVEYGLQEGNFDYVLVNDDLDQACAEFVKVVNELYGIKG